MLDNGLLDKGFVFGKFYPLHLGHVAMIQFALNHCQQLDVVVCCSNKELIRASTRAGWLREEFSAYPQINIIEYDYDESILPNTSESQRDVAKLWASAFKALLPDVKLLVTSEDYGDYVAEYMNIHHIGFDHDRSRVPISASNIRENFLEFWDYLPNSVKRFFQKTVIISGTESTGKTELAKFLAQYFPSALVGEIGRDIISDSNHFSLQDLAAVAHQHAEAIATAKRVLVPLVIIDTDVYVTQSYAHYKFDKQLELSAAIYAANQADLRLYLDASVPYVQDGTRLSELERNALDLQHRKILHCFAQDYQEISGTDWDLRYAAAREFIANLFSFSKIVY